jgi:sugar phosphate isomerase/epimerase
MSSSQSRGEQVPSNITWSVFTKPWPSLSATELGDKVAALGFSAVELPVREGFQVNPDRVERDLPTFAAALADRAVGIHSVASSTDEAVFAACAAVGVAIIRVMLPVGESGYLATEKTIRQWLDDTMPLCERYGVQVGIQPHHGRYISDATGLRALIADYPSRYVGAVWDGAHDALAGQQPEYSLELLWSHLAMVNLKNGFYLRTSGPESNAEWRTYFTTGAQGLADWPRIAAYLDSRSYAGAICLTAEYSAGGVDEFIGPDLTYAKSLF